MTLLLYYNAGCYWLYMWLWYCIMLVVIDCICDFGIVLCWLLLIVYVTLLLYNIMMVVIRLYMWLCYCITAWCYWLYIDCSMLLIVYLMLVVIRLFVTLLLYNAGCYWLYMWLCFVMLVLLDCICDFVIV